MTTFSIWLLSIAIFLFIVASLGFYIGYKSVKKDIENALKSANPIEQAEIRKQLVRAMFPPRFPRH